MVVFLYYSACSRSSTGEQHASRSPEEQHPPHFYENGDHDDRKDSSYPPHELEAAHTILKMPIIRNPVEVSGADIEQDPGSAVNSHDGTPGQRLGGVGSPVSPMSTIRST